MSAHYDGAMATTESRDPARRHTAQPPSEHAVDALLSDQPRMLNLRQVADVLSSTQPMVRRLVDAGALPAVRLTRQWRVARDDLRTFLLTPSDLEGDEDSDQE